MNVTIIGAGKMGEALARGILQAGLISPNELILSDVSTKQLQALADELRANAATDNATAVCGASLVILAIKPNIITQVCEDIAPSLPAGAIVLSIAAGIPLRQLAGALTRKDIVIARAMPNTPCLVGEGAIGLCFSDSAPAAARAAVTELLTPTGLVLQMPEALLDAVTGLSGSGPAFVALFIEALADGGVLMGLPRAQAAQLAAQTVFGTAKMILETGSHPAQVKDMVSSPGGTTIAGIAALEQAGFRSAAITAVQAATLRSKELSKG